ncbi:Nif3-like dinuclear metal center hexameric protein [Deinococcus metallilatus]|uniref:GTP cyclohydrolase 1 type 2 homolog n=1 Tax=Deinococcus metallilatus TaxID=1211322 RepID=A0AAJ5F8J6_9DEIO|nr:Nif3-like dinuclear metal center hexameric protein [Deinococcus metallilatus]MBB5295502.1 dinuclear metal center YbgI/SA1388 family protein [Deinococcus metallilatus]QBY07983.1 Nif3-like dinuclear metal center hexameric protein [Deinococcus metallilatus]RXJ12876.1 Nif3-like dinuclear metal center hexameric protein [Deinococcus metallilatus]TLK27202.1 Nif3-like dinuclear metal center hexameric protein [Deinococcus metallilatus]GMA16180.1 GTP cyclohydrolase 1 type 2 [Deinococcus metallilatus]
MTDPTPTQPQRGEVDRDTLVRWLNEYLNIAAYPDPSLNGLQIEGTDVIRRVAASVDTSVKTLQDAADSGADLLLVHHGLFWGQPLALTGPHRARVRTALMADLNLYAAHLPLDAHPEVGNNAMIARALSLQQVRPFGDWQGHKIGLAGELPFPQSLQDFADRVQKLTGEICLVHGGGPPNVQRLGIVSGSGAGAVAEAAAAGLDTLLTGEPEHKHFYDAFEYGVNVVFAGHYETEVFGVRALAARLEEEFGLPWQFLHHPTGL